MKKIFIGIDFSKEKFDATLIQAEGLKECAPEVCTECLGQQRHQAVVVW